MSLFDIFGDSNENQARQDQIKGLRQGQQEALKYLGQGQTALTGQYNQALGGFAPYASLFAKGANLYGDALGLGGAQGTANAQGAFHTSPGYQFQLGQGLEALDRTAASRGMLGSGNTSADTINYAQGVANQDYGNWLNRLQPYNSLGLQTAGAQGGIHTGLGEQLLGIDTNRANLGWATNTGIGQANASYQMAKENSGNNLFGAIMGGLNLGTQLLGGGGGPSGLATLLAGA